MPTNSAAWLVAAKTEPLEVKPAPYTAPDENEIVVKNHALAINPEVDWALQKLAMIPRNYPNILGTDIAGEVFEVGSSVTRFKKGDRVLAHALGMTTNRDSESAFQEYSVCRPQLTAQIPDSLSFEKACVIPLGISTPACGLYQKDYLGLEYPSLNPKPTGKTLLVWGGASSVGSNAIQLAVASGYEVITTASTKNFDFVKKLGASQAFDYKSETIVKDLIDALKGKECAGAIEFGGHDGVAFKQCLEIVMASHGKKFVAAGTQVRLKQEDLPSGIGAKFIFGSDLKDNDVGPAIFERFLPQALAEGKYIAAPDPIVVGKGLEHVQKGLDTWSKGISAGKVVITL